MQLSMWWIPSSGISKKPESRQAIPFLAMTYTPRLASNLELHVPEGVGP